MDSVEDASGAARLEPSGGESACPDVHGGRLDEGVNLPAPVMGVDPDAVEVLKRAMRIPNRLES